jgi:hypothetical protein
MAFPIAIHLAILRAMTTVMADQGISITGNRCDTMHAILYNPLVASDTRPNEP